jgi:hypothetical protein
MLGGLPTSALRLLMLAFPQAAALRWPEFEVELAAQHHHRIAGWRESSSWAYWSGERFPDGTESQPDDWSQRHLEDDAGTIRVNC